MAYNILKYLEDDMVENKEIQSGQCSECTINILTSPIKVLTILSCGHIFHRPCIKKQLLHTKPSTCQFTDCGENINIIVDPNSIRRGLQSSQSNRTSALTNLIGEKFVLNSPVIPEEGRPEDSMDVDPDSNVALMSVLLSGREQ
ncbi:2572_t:CDS:1, partial [Paraglomus brasilianum]